MQTLADLADFLRAPRRVTLIGHRNPDGDAIGSTLGLSRALTPRGHEVSIVVPSELPAFLGFLDGVDDVLVFDVDADASTAAIRDAELIVLMDFNALDRIDKTGEVVAQQTGTPRVLIDHHLDPEPIADVMFSDVDASSTCELVYRALADMGHADWVTPPVAEALMTGILTDTGGFSYATTPTLFRVVAELFEVGVDNERLQDAVFNSMSEKQLRILGYCLHERLEVFPELGAALITLTKQDYEYYDIRRGDTEGIVNYMLRIGGIELAGFITEQPKITKVSLRSKGDVDVRAIARDNFKGGGHLNAAGGYSHAGLRHAVATFKRAIAARVGAAVPQ